MAVAPNPAVAVDAAEAKETLEVPKPLKALGVEAGGVWAGGGGVEVEGAMAEVWPKVGLEVCPKVEEPKVEEPKSGRAAEVVPNVLVELPRAGTEEAPKVVALVEAAKAAGAATGAD